MSAKKGFPASRRQNDAQIAQMKGSAHHFTTNSKTPENTQIFTNECVTSVWETKSALEDIATIFGLM